MKHRIVAALLMLIATASAVAAGNGAGIRAYEARNFDKAIEKLTPAAEKGDAEAQYYLALSLKGKLPKSSPSETDSSQQAVFAWLEKSANQGYAAGQRDYADALDDGFGTQVDYQRALEWMQKAVEAGDEQARVKLAGWYTNGHIVPPDAAKAADLRKFAALSDGADTQSRLDAMRKVLEATRQYMDAKAAASDKFTDEDIAAAGDPRAAIRLAGRARNDKEKQDCDAAAKWFQRAGEAGDARGFQSLGSQYYKGDCGPQDFAKARDAYQRAAAIGDAFSLSVLARMEMFGHGQAPDYPAAYVHLKALEIADPSWLKNDPGPLNFVTRQLSAEQRTAADARVAALTPDLHKAAERLKNKEMARPLKSEGDATSALSYTLAMIDRTGTCAQNYLNQCSYVPFETQLDIHNRGDVTLDCKLQLVAKFFPTMESKTLTRRYLLRPSTAKRPRIGTIAGEVDPIASGLACERVPQPTVASGTCVIEPPGGVDLDKYYPKAAKSTEQQGTVTLAITLKDAKGVPADVQVDKTSGYPLLDEGALQFARETAFDTNCPGERLIMPLQFKLQ